VTSGGAELPLTNIAVLSALTIAGPGKLSVDGLLGIRLPRWIGATALAAMFAGLWLGARDELERALGALARDAADAAGVSEASATKAERPGSGAEGPGPRARRSGRRPAGDLVGVMDAEAATASSPESGRGA
jgi:hypothetical protein